MTAIPWKIIVRMKGDAGEVQIEQDAPNGTSTTRECVIAQAVTLYKAMADAKN